MTLLAALACAGSPPPPTSPPTPDPAPPKNAPHPPPPPEPIDPAKIPGSWVSKPCGERTWVRTFSFEAGGAYHGQDPVSPCPPGAACVWSGIIDFSGTWTAAGTSLQLAEAPAQMAGQYQRPAALTLTGGVLYDPAGCAFERQ